MTKDNVVELVSNFEEVKQLKPIHSCIKLNKKNDNIENKENAKETQLLKPIKNAKETNEFENNENAKKIELYKESRSESGLKAAQGALRWTPYDGLESNKNETLDTEHVRSDMTTEQPPVVDLDQHLVHLHHKKTRELYIEAVKGTKIESLKQELSKLKQVNTEFKERLAKTKELKTDIIKTGKMRKLHIEELKKEIAENEEIQEELLAIVKPIKEGSSVRRLKQKNDLVVELLNTLSFLNYEISELQEKEV